MDRNTEITISHKSRRSSSIFIAPLVQYSWPALLIARVCVKIGKSNLFASPLRWRGMCAAAPAPDCLSRRNFRYKSEKKGHEQKKAGILIIAESHLTPRCVSVYEFRQEQLSPFGARRLHSGDGDTRSARVKRRASNSADKASACASRNKTLAIMRTADTQMGT